MSPPDRRAQRKAKRRQDRIRPDVSVRPTFNPVALPVW